MARTQEYTAKEVAEALRQSNGVVKQAASMLDCHPSTVYRYAERYVTVEEAMENSRLDLAFEAEGYLVAALRDRNHKAHHKAISDVLRMYHPDFKDSKQEIEHSGDGFSVQINPPADD